MYETFEHTADLGLRVRAASLELLFTEAAQALFSAIVEDLASIRLERKVEIILDGDAWDLLLFDWLKELLYHFDAEHLLLGKFDVQLNGKHLIAAAWGETLDVARHCLEHEVKAITYHGLRVERVDGEWLAEVIVDI